MIEGGVIVVYKNDSNNKSRQLHTKYK